MKLISVDKFIGDKLYEARVVKRLTQGDVSEAITKQMKKKGSKKGISRQAYALYETGQRSMPNDLFQYACEFLNLDWKEIFNEALESLKVK